LDQHTNKRADDGSVAACQQRAADDNHRDGVELDPGCGRGITRGRVEGKDNPRQGGEQARQLLIRTFVFLTGKPVSSAEVLLQPNA